MIFPLHERRTFRLPSRFAGQMGRLVAALLKQRGWIVISQDPEPDNSILFVVEDVRSFLER